MHTAGEYQRAAGEYRRFAEACLNLVQEYNETSTKRELAEMANEFLDLAENAESIAELERRRDTSS
jgi:hypothetical protein